MTLSPPVDSAAGADGPVVAIPNIDTVREIALRCSNWGRWGPDDQLGTLNYIRPSDITSAAKLVRTGRPFSLAIPLDENGPRPAASAASTRST